jgi:cyclopropane-fatty-acyl-phospholipid synthase
MLLDAVLRRTLLFGRLEVAYANGRAETYGDGSGPPVAIRLTTAGALRIAVQPELGLGEAYMNGELTFERGELWDLLTIVGRNLHNRPDASRNPMVRIRNALQRQILQANNRATARRNVAHHYDLSIDLYRRFLDTDMQYSCAYFARPDMSLEEAQSAKKAHLAAKLALEPGMRVLDIGCGWGGLGLTLARDYGAKVTGITLSAEQLAVANRRAEDSGLSPRLRFDLIDYRDVDGPFDRIVSVGMFEHVGAPNYRAFFERISELLTDDGVALIHSIARIDPPGVTNPFIRKYIFPGGYIPALSQVTAAVEQAGLWTTDLEVLRLHYAETLRHWRERFTAQRPAIALAYDERFCRMWEFYLALSELSFRAGGDMVCQIQLAKRVDTLPITRDYMFDAERSAPAAAASQPRRARI